MTGANDLEIEAGQLRHLVTIQAQGDVQRDSFGQPSAPWQNARANTYAGLNLVSMHEAFGDGQLTSQATDVFTLRWTSTPIAGGMRILFGSRTFRILAADNVSGRNVLWHVLALEVNGPGAN